jgi:DNA polymerase-3 subunit alpha
MARIKAITPITDSGLDDAASGEVFDQIAKFAGYGFNKSHAAAYAAIAFQTAYLKTHHPESFFAAAMNLDLSEVDKIAVFAAEMKERQVPLWQPSVNASRAIFTPIKLRKAYHGHDFGLAYGLCAMRGVGRSVADAIEHERVANGVYRDLADFMKRTHGAVPRNALKALAKAGAFDIFGLGRAEALATASGHDTKANVNQMSLFETMEDAAPSVDIPDLSQDEILDNEFDVLGHYMSAHPLDVMKSDLFEDGLYFSHYVLKGGDGRQRKASMAAIVTATDVRRTNAGETMAVINLSDPEGSYEALVFGDTWNEIRHLMKKKARVILDIAVSTRGGDRRLIVEGAQALNVTAEAQTAPSGGRKAA